MRKSCQLSAVSCPLLLLLLLVSMASAVPQPRTTQAPKAPPRAGAPGGPTDFSGVWEVDPTASSGGASNMEGAVLEVTQKGDRIWIQPTGPSRRSVLAEEVVVDGRSYQKGVGAGQKGTLTAKWGTDAKSLWLEVTAGPPEDPRAAVQRSVWRLSEDRSTWVRETVTMTSGTARRSRLVFRRQKTKPGPGNGKR